MGSSQHARRDQVLALHAGDVVARAARVPAGVVQLIADERDRRAVDDLGVRGRSRVHVDSGQVVGLLHSRACGKDLGLVFCGDGAANTVVGWEVSESFQLLGAFVQPGSIQADVIQAKEIHTTLGLLLGHRKVLSYFSLEIA